MTVEMRARAERLLALEAALNPQADGTTAFNRKDVALVAREVLALLDSVAAWKASSEANREQAELQERAVLGQSRLLAEVAELRSALEDAQTFIRREHPGHGPTGFAPRVAGCETCGILARLAPFASALPAVSADQREPETGSLPAETEGE